MVAAHMFRFVVGATVLSIALGQSSTSSTTTYQYKWFPETGYSCQSQSGDGYNLPIGTDERTFDTGITLDYCKKRCAQEQLCQGFDFQDLGEEQPPVCRYKGKIDGDTLTKQLDTTCYVYERPAVVPLTTPKPTTLPPTTCADVTGCIAGSCDSHIISNHELTCASLEKDIGCNCKGCMCPVFKKDPSTTTTTKSAVSKADALFEFVWDELKGSDCVSTMDSAMQIGEGVSADGERKTYDKWTVENCKEKCARHPKCGGFNYNARLGICRYKISLDHSKSIPKPFHDCWIYDRNGTRPSIGSGTKFTTSTKPATTFSFPYGWIEEAGHDCASPKLSQNLHIGDTKSPSGVQRTYDIASVDYCKRKCHQYVKCDGFNYEFEMSMCRYKSGISNSQLLPDENHQCYVYMRSKATPRPETTTTTPAPKTIPGDTCVEKTSCMTGSCDYAIANADVPVTCNTLEAVANCNCAGCKCPTSTTSSSTKPSFAYGWTSYPLKVCTIVMDLYPTGSQLPIGYDNQPYDSGKTADQCKTICSKHPLCMGFNYEASLNFGTCRYYTNPPTKLTNPFGDDTAQTCYAYSRPATTTVPSTPSTPSTAPPFTTPTTSVPEIKIKTSAAGGFGDGDGATDAPDNSQNKPANGGVIAGAVVGTLVGLAAIVGVVVAVLFVMKSNNKPRGYSQTYHNANNLDADKTNEL